MAASVIVLLFPYVEESSGVGHAAPIAFPPIERELVEGVVHQIGRRVDRRRARPAGGSNDGLAAHFYDDDADEGPAAEPAAGALPEPPSQESESRGSFISFRSKVVSRQHAELWLQDGQVHFRDAGSSSGSFINRLRLSASNKRSRAYALDSGDVIQLGVDYQGRLEDIFKCVTVRVIIRPKAPLGDWQMFNRGLGLLTQSYYRGSSEAPAADASPVESDDEPLVEHAATDCCICLSALAPASALFVSPCAHVFHLKCIFPLLHSGVMFHCPLCRGWFNLWKNVERAGGSSICAAAESADDPAVEPRVEQPDQGTETPPSTTHCASELARTLFRSSARPDASGEAEGTSASVALQSLFAPVEAAAAAAAAASAAAVAGPIIVSPVVPAAPELPDPVATVPSESSAPRSTPPSCVTTPATSYRDESDHHDAASVGDAADVGHVVDPENASSDSDATPDSVQPPEEGPNAGPPESDELGEAAAAPAAETAEEGSESSGASSNGESDKRAEAAIARPERRRSADAGHLRKVFQRLTSRMSLKKWQPVDHPGSLSTSGGSPRASRSTPSLHFAVLGESPGGTGGDPDSEDSGLAASTTQASLR